MTTLAAFQSAFAASLQRVGDADAAEPPAMRIYRNTVWQGRIGAMRANFPAVLHALGQSTFDALAIAFLCAHAPTQRSLYHLGAEFASFLVDAEECADTPWLPGLATLDRLWLDVHAAHDDAPISAAQLARLPAAAMATLRLRTVRAARWRWFDGQAVVTAWQAARRGQPFDAAAHAATHGEGALVVRLDDTVHVLHIDQPACALLHACRRGRRLLAAARLTHDDQSAHRFASLLQAGAFTLGETG